VLKVYSKAFQFPSGIKLEHLLSCEWTYKFFCFITLTYLIFSLLFKDSVS
jgi:hypothetical protein